MVPMREQVRYLERIKSNLPPLGIIHGESNPIPERPK